MTYALLNLSVPDLETRIQPGLDSVERLLQESAGYSRGLVSDLISHLAVAGGKRMRPVLSLVAGQLGSPGSEPNQEVISAATVVELTHLASLYHDDVMDSAPTRRGVESAHHLWGNNRAILAGDVLFARASQLTVGLGMESVRHHARIFERMCMGQLNESFGPDADDDAVEFYLQVLADKTGALVAAAGYLGAKHGGASEEVAHAVEEFGEKIGVAFQLADDVLDIRSSGEESGKTPGTDLREGVDTMPVLLLRRAGAAGAVDSAGRKILAGLERDLEDDANLAAVVKDLRAHPVLQQTADLARSWADDARDAIDWLPESEAKTALFMFAEQMIDRQV